MHMRHSALLHGLWLTLACALVLPGEALAGWGNENWGTMVWGQGGSPPVLPALGVVGLTLLAMGLVAAAAWTLRKRRPALGLTLSLVLLAIPLAVAAGTLAVPNTFVNGTPADAGQVNANFDAVETEVNDNDSRITTNATAISANTGNISANTGNISANTGNIAANATVASDAAAVAANAKNLANIALADAATAQGTANTAVADAAAAQGTANTAVADAATAQTTADAAQAILSTQGPHDRPGDNDTAVGEEALLNNTIGGGNTAVGFRALYENTEGLWNTAVGDLALKSNNGVPANATFWGSRNTAVGTAALFSNTNGRYNTAVGNEALRNNTEGRDNTSVGSDALRENITGIRNTAVGEDALKLNTDGDRNIALGERAGYFLTTGDDNVAISHQGVAGASDTTWIGAFQTRAFIAGIRDVTTDAADAVAVLIDSNGQLGTASSSGRYKEAIEDMGAQSAALQKLRPVTFRYKKPFADGTKPIQFGLIAEEVAEVFPELVVVDGEGKPETVKYHLLSSLLLNELQQLAKSHEVLRAEKDAEIAALKQRLALVERLSARLAKLETGAYVVAASAEGTVSPQWE